MAILLIRKCVGQTDMKRYVYKNNYVSFGFDFTWLFWSYSGLVRHHFGFAH